MLEVKSVHKSFGGLMAVNDCSLSVREGTVQEKPHSSISLQVSINLI